MFIFLNKKYLTFDATTADELLEWSPTVAPANLATMVTELTAQLERTVIVLDTRMSVVVGGLFVAVDVVVVVGRD